MSIRPAKRESTMTVTLVTFSKSGERKSFTLSRESTVIGRKTDADLRIPLNEISRAHCELTMNGKSVSVRDLGSSNGTYVNGERVEDDFELSAGDKIRMGSVMFVVQIDGKPDKVTPAMFAPPAPTGGAAPARKAAADAPTMASGAADLDDADVEDVDVDDLDDLDIDDLSDIDLSDEDSDELGELEELSEDDLIVDEDDDK